MLEAYKGLVHRVARSFKTRISLYDLLQEGRIGLMEAFDTFDTSLNLQFSTHAVWIVRKHISHYIRTHENLVREPSWICDYQSIVRRNAAKLEAAGMLTDENLAKACKMSVDRVRGILDHPAQIHNEIGKYSTAGLDGFTTPPQLTYVMGDLISDDTPSTATLMYEQALKMIEEGATVSVLMREFNLTRRMANKLNSSILALEAEKRNEECDGRA